MLSEDAAWSQMGVLKGESIPEAALLPLVGFWQDGLVVCLIVLTMRVKMNLFIYYELGLIPRPAGSVASAFIDGALHRETSN